MADDWANSIFIRKKLFGKINKSEFINFKLNITITITIINNFLICQILIKVSITIDIFILIKKLKNLVFDGVD